jgi:hypothetical protein
MDAQTRAAMLKLVEGKSDGIASIELTADDLFACVDNGLYPSNGPISMGGGSSAGKALSALEGLAKLGYDKRDIATLKGYFDHCVEAEALRSDASRSLGRMRDEYYDDLNSRDKGRGVGVNVARAY